MMKKIISVLVLSLLITGLISCGGNEESEGNGEIYVDKKWDIYEEGHNVTAPVTIDFWSANSAVDIHGATTNDLAEKFNAMQKEKYPDSPITVRMAFQNGYNVQNSKLQAALIGNTNPDLAMIGVSSMSLYVDNAIDMRRIFTYDQIRNIHDGFLQFAMYKHVFSAYPFFAATNLAVVNRDIVKASGVSVPTCEELVADPVNSTWNWELFEEYLAAARDTEKDIYGAATANIPLYEVFYTQGVPIYNETATKALLDNEYGLKAFTFWQNIVKKDYVKNPVLDPNHGTKAQADFMNGKVGMLLNSSSIIKALYASVVETQIAQGKEPLFEMDVLPYPKVTNYYSNQSGGNIMIFNNKSDQRTKAAVEFLRWMQEDEQTVEFSTRTGYLAATKSATSSQAWVDYAKTNPLLDRAVKLMVFAPKDLKLPMGRAKAIADEDLAKYAKGLFYDNFTRTPQDVLKECQDRVGYLLESNS